MTVQQTGSLEAYGFDEIEPMVVEDTPANCRRIRMLEGDWQWEPVLDEDQLPTGLIRVLDPTTLTARRAGVYERRKAILADPDDMWSDYAHPDDYPLDVDVPFWIQSRLAKWKREARDGIPESERTPFPVRCTTFRHDETRCWNWAGNPVKVDRCKAHLGWVEAAQLKAAAYAKQKIVGSTLDAADRLAFLVEHGETHAVQLKASTEILDRGGVRAGYEIDQRVEVELIDPSVEVKERLSRLAEAHVHKQELEVQARAKAELLERDTVQGEVVSNDERRALPSGE